MTNQLISKSKTLGIVGFGKEGQAIFQHFEAEFDQIYIFEEKLQNSDLERLVNSTVISNNEKISRSKTIVRLFNNFDIPTEVDFLVKSPGVATYKVILQNKDLKIQSLVSLLFQKLDMSKVIAVTGTKGKSTVSSLIAHILKTGGHKVELLGNIGNINTGLLDNFDPDTYYVFELSSFQCQQLTNSPHIAIWTNFFIDHQDVHKDMQEYYEAKANICRFQNPQDYFVTIPALAKVQTQASKVIIQKTLKFQTKLLGQHNQVNCQFALDACQLIGLETDQILQAIGSFEPIRGRLEKVNQVFKNQQLIEFYADDLATIPEATWQAILAFEGKVETLITGGYDKGSDYTELSKNLIDSKIQNIIYFNPTGHQIVAQLDSKKIDLVEARSMDEAVKLAFKLTCRGVCLLSCASASFGMFQNAYDRGQQYRDCIVKAKNKMV